MTSKRYFAVAGILILVFVIRMIGDDESPNITELKIEPGNASTRLVVILHAFTNSRDDMQDIIDVTRDRFGDADILAPNYNTSTFANTSLTRTAAQLDREIQRVVDAKQESGGEYTDIILVGHSVGALVARKTYLYSLGIGEDHPWDITRIKPTEWNRKVDRIILLAGMNRGWSTETMSPLERVRTWFGRMIFTLTDKGKMIRSIERGTPFISNLKMDWIRAANDHQIEAQIVQILGKNDRLAPLDAHKELMATPNFIFIPLLEGATHGNIIDLVTGEDEDANDHNRELRKEAFLEALAQPLVDLRNRYGSNSSFLDEVEPNRRSVKHVVFVMHGIRDHGEWLERFSEQLEQAEPGIKAITSEYGYFPMARFLLFHERDRNVRWFVDQYTEALALYPEAKKISFIGHSNGTYLLARALDRYYPMKFYRVYFAGSVVHSNYPWDTYVARTRRVQDFRNDIAIDDWVVAWFPKLYQLINPDYVPEANNFFNLGSGGFNGFTNPSGKKHVKFVSGGHSGALQDEHIPSIVEFITRDTVPLISNETDLDENAREVSSSKLGVTSNIAWVIWLGLFVIVSGIGYLFVRIATASKRLTTNHAIGIYLALILAIVYSI